MRIYNVTFKSNTQIPKPNTSEPKPDLSYASSNELFKGIDTAGKSLVLLKSTMEQAPSIDESFFMLHDGVLPDEHQKRAAAELSAGKDVLVTMPTGMGKTAIAQYVITKNMKEGVRTYYTTPLKALSYQKFRDFQKLYGEENVGILTGDVKIRPNAPVVIMTTEVYRNQVVADRQKDLLREDSLKNLKTVIFDEMHYLGDPERGGAWELSVILTPPDVQMLSLSATVGNKHELNGWLSSIRGKQCSLINVSPKERPVRLKYKNISLSKERSKHKKENFHPKRLDYYGCMPVVNRLKTEEQLPAIFFVFSKKQCKNLIDDFGRQAVTLTTPEDKIEIDKAISEFKKQGKYLSREFDLHALSKGYAIHNSSLMPTEKELVEDLFKRKLVKVVFATETLAAGINMPAKTTVITASEKPASFKMADENGMRELTVNEFHQMAGRAGRRGMDKEGFVYTLSTSQEQADVFNELFYSKPNPIESQFSPDFSFITEYYKHNSDDVGMEELLSKSFYAYDAASPTKARENKKKIIKEFKNNCEILKKFGYLSENNIPTEKGELLSLLNGYEQIPIIEMIHDRKLPLQPMELAASIGALISTNEASVARAERSNQLPTNKFILLYDAYINKYNSVMQRFDKSKKVAFNQSIVKRIYSWLDKNAKMGDSIANWRHLCAQEAYEAGVDEGTFFREVTQAIDLLKQIGNVVNVGMKTSGNLESKRYYSQLKEAAQEAIKLLSKEPVINLKF